MNANTQNTPNTNVSSALINQTACTPSFKLPSMKRLFTSLLFSMLAPVMLLSSVTSAQAADVKIVANVKAASEKVNMCIGCHALPGYKASFPFVYHVPLLGGQNEAYIAKALKAYKSGERKHPSMRAIAYSLTDQDIADLSAYYAQQTAATSENTVR